MNDGRVLVLYINDVIRMTSYTELFMSDGRVLVLLYKGRQPYLRPCDGSTRHLTLRAVHILDDYLLNTATKGSVQ